MGAAGVTISYHQAWRGKEVAQRMILGSNADGNGKHEHYCREIIIANPPSAVFICNNDGRFERMCIAYKASLGEFVIVGLSSGLMVRISGKAVLEGLTDVIQGAAYGYCIRHLVDNMCKSFKNSQLIPAIWKVALARSQTAFDTAIAEMGAIDNEAVNWR